LTIVVVMALLQLLRVGICWSGTEGDDEEEDDDEESDKSAG
jgi:hypothetical protein